MTDTHFILASQSPRRRALLSLLRYPFEIIISGVDEDAHQEIGPANYVLRTAQNKAEAVARAIDAGNPRRLVIAADTTVALDGAILGKPRDADEARQMLRALGGRPHEVHTGLCVTEPGTGREISSVHSLVVTMRNYSLAEIDAYVATGDPLDKAGAYGIQYPAFSPVERLDGCYLAVMGLSLCELILVLQQFGVPIRADRAQLAEAHQGFACPVYNTIRWP